MVSGGGGGGESELENPIKILKSGSNYIYNIYFLFFFYLFWSHRPT